jgi:hypothetical protein
MANPFLIVPKTVLIRFAVSTETTDVKESWEASSSASCAELK